MERAAADGFRQPPQAYALPILERNDPNFRLALASAPPEATRIETNNRTSSDTWTSKGWVNVRCRRYRREGDGWRLTADGKVCDFTEPPSWIVGSGYLIVAQSSLTYSGKYRPVSPFGAAA